MRIATAALTAAAALVVAAGAVSSGAQAKTVPVVPVVPVVPGVPGVPVVPGVAASAADHWGYFFGDNVKADGDETRQPAAIGLPAPVAEIGTSNSTQYALLTDGTVWAWGQGTNGELGDGGSANSFAAAVQVQFPPGVRIAFIPADAMPFDTGLAVDTSGNAWGWGLNKRGELCLGNRKPHLTPVQLPLAQVTALAGAQGHAVYDAGGTVVSCGNNTDGVLGDGSTSSSNVPVQVSGLQGQSVTELVSSWLNAGALLADGEYLDWGFDAQGQLGNGTVERPSAVPVPVNLPDSAPVTQVAEGGSTSGNGQTLVMLSDGSLFAWGSDTDAQLGDGQEGGRQPSPERIHAPAGVTYAVLASGGATSYAVTTAGSVYAWGNSKKGEVGDGTTTTATAPVMVDSGATLISSTAGNVAVAAG